MSNLLGTSFVYGSLISWSCLYILGRSPRYVTQPIRPVLRSAATPAPSAALLQEAQRLREELARQKVQMTAEFQESTFQQLQSLLTNYPSVRQMAAANPELPAQNITALFSALDQLVAAWGYESIGPVWEQVPYDPQLHQPDSSEIQPGESVYIRFVGYRHGDQILCPAKVSRTLPGGSD